MTRRATQAARVGIIAALVLVAFSLRAQTAESGAIKGTVLDVTGKPIPAAVVFVKNEASGAQLSAVADQEGKLSFSNLAAGSYTIEVSAPSFAPSRRTGVKLAANAIEN